MQYCNGICLKEGGKPGCSCSWTILRWNSLPSVPTNNINWNKLQVASQNILSTLSNATTEIPGFNSSDHTALLSNVGIPLTGSIATGFVVGFMKGSVIECLTFLRNINRWNQMRN